MILKIGRRILKFGFQNTTMYPKHTTNKENLEFTKKL